MASTDVVDPELNQAVQDRNAALGSGNFLREVLAPFLQLPEVVFHAAAPEGEQTVRAAVGKPWKAAQVSSNDVPLLPYTPFMQSDVVTLVLSPFPNRRATLKLEPYDRPWDGDKFSKDATAYVRPSPLPSSPLIPRLCPFHVSREKQVQREADGAYGKLTYILREDVKAFTNLTCTLARAGFSSMDGKKALMETGWSLKWIKRLLPSDCSKLRFNAFQKINRFPGSWRVDKKDSLQRQMQLAERRWKYGQQNGQVKQDFGAHLYPEGWVLPEEAEACEVALRSASNQGVLFIAKPTESSCGRGIFLLQGGPDVQLPDLSVPVVGTPSATPPMKYVIQRYIANPYLVHGYKFDLRLYVVITSYEPFRMYLYHEGLVRFATTPYRALSADGKEGAVADAQFLTAHLTNFTLNKKTEDFHAPTPESTNTGAKSSELNPMWASKWSLSALREHMTREGVYSWNDTIDAVQDLLAKVFLSIAPEVRADTRKAEAAMNRLKQPNSPVDEDASKSQSSTSPPYTHRGISPFFEVYGVDVLLRQSTTATGQRCLSPVIMEVNNAPALSTHYAPLDQCIKGNLLADVFNLVGLTSMAFKVSGGATQAPPGGFRQLFVDAGSSEADIREGAFLDQLCITDPTHVKVEACLTASEEQRRSPSFLCVIPSPTSASVYSPLFSRMPEEETADGLASITCDESLDSVLSSWAKSRNTTT